MNSLYRAVARVVVRYRFLVVAAWIAVAVVSMKTLPSLTAEVNNNNTQFLPASAPSQKAANLAGPLVGPTGSRSPVLVVATRRQGQLTREDLAALEKGVRALRSSPGVVMASLAKVSPDGTTAVIQLEVHAPITDVRQQKTVVDAVERRLDALRFPADLEVHPAGQVATNVANQASSDRTSRRIQDLTFLLIILLLLAIFRAPLAALVTLIPPGLALLVSMRFIGGLGASGLKISEITDLLLIVLMLGAGTDYGLFLVFRVKEFLLGGMEPRQAVEEALVRVGESISASAGTVILALLTLLLASFGIYHDLGVPLALGVAVMLLAGLTLLPALLAIFGRALFWPTRTVAARDRRGLWGRIAGRVVSRPAITLGVGVVFFLGLAGVAVGWNSGGFGGAISAPKGSSTQIGNAILAAKFPQTSANPANLVLEYPEPVFDHPSEVLAAERVLNGSRQFTQLSGPLNPNGTRLSPAEYARLHHELGDPRALPTSEPPGTGVSAREYNAYRATALFVDRSGTVVQFEATLRAGGQQTTSALDATPQIRKVLAEAARSSGASRSGLAGEAASLYDVNRASNSDLVHIIPIAILAIALLLGLVLRSVVAPFYLILSVVLSYLAALGVSTLVFIDIAGEQGLTFILPFLMFIFLLALGEDYNILVMTRIREEAHHRDLQEAVVEAVGRTGPTVTSAGMILAGTFGVVAAAGGGGPGGTQIRDIGFGLAIGILMDTFLVRTLLVPSTVALLGRLNWWPSGMGRRSEHSEPAASSGGSRRPADRQGASAGAGT